MTTDPVPPTRYWTAKVSWPDGHERKIAIHADDAAEAEKYCRDIWGASVTVTVTPRLEA